MKEDALGAAFERGLAGEQRRLLGQYYTPRPVAELLVALTLRAPPRALLDPGCGSGGLLLSAYGYMRWRWGMSHAQALGRLWGIERNPEAAALAVRNLRGLDVGEAVAPKISVGDFFAARAEEAPAWDCLVGNPPYLRSQNQDDLKGEGRGRLFAAAAAAGVEAHAKTDLFAFFIYHAAGLMRVGARLGFVTPASWLTADYAGPLQQLLTSGLRLRALVGSGVESFCPQVDMHTVLMIAERVAEGAAEPPMRFVTLKQRTIAQWTEGPGERWGRVSALARAIEGPGEGYEDAQLRVSLVPVGEEREALRAGPRVARNWSRVLRAPRSFARLCGSPAMTSLGQVARVSLGFKSLQNEFYYVDRSTVEQYGIEARFLTPVSRLGDLDGGRYMQGAGGPRFIFVCRASAAELVGTGALRYIEAMAERPAAQRRQGQAGGTIRSALAAQGGELWYGPKARAQAAHVWLRKAVGAVYAPLLFAQAGVVDQRCNYIEPLAGGWEPLAAVLTGSAFAYALEMEGAANLGGGALEASTSKLRGYPVFDPRRLAADEEATLVALGRAMWAEERPVRWGPGGSRPGPRLEALDAWLLARAQVAVTVAQLHEDLRAACEARVGAGR